MCLTFWVPYRDLETYVLVYDWRMISRRYIKGWLIPDLISIFPFELIHKSWPWCYGLSSLLRLWRISKVWAMFSRWEENTSVNYFLIQSIKLLSIAAFTIHCEACLYYKLAVHYPSRNETWIAAVMPHFMEESMWRRYSLALYWAVTTFTTVGYGDLHSTNMWEYNLSWVFMAINNVLSVCLCAKLGDVVVHGREVQRFRDIVRAAQLFGQRNKLSGRVQGEITQHFQLDYRRKLEQLQDEKFIHLVPKALRYKIRRELFGSLVASAYLFEGVSQNLRFQLTAEMKAEYFLPNTDVILQNEQSTDFYIIVSGSVELLASIDGVEQAVGTVFRGELCGELGVLCYTDQLFTVRTRTLTQLLRVERKTFLDVVEEKPEDLSIVMTNVYKHLIALNYAGMGRVFRNMASLIETGQSKLPVSPCFAARTDNDILLTHLLVRRRLDANQSDLKGKTALHVGVLAESEKCVKLLLQSGADVNRRDFDGRVPLWEAMVLESKVMVQLLEENGAKLTTEDFGMFFCEASRLGRVDLLEEIIRLGGDIKLAKEDDGNGALHVAIINKSTEVVKYLLENGLDIDQENNEKQTPYILAQKQGVPQDIRDLIAARRAEASGSGSG